MCLLLTEKLIENHPCCSEFSNDQIHSLCIDERGEKAWDYSRSREISIYLGNSRYILF